MNTSQIKNFAIQSRNVLKAGVLNRILALGFDEKGRTVVDLPVKIQGGTVFMNQLREESFFDAWTALATRLEKHGFKDVCEEAAYTWFNRLVAIRIMQKNHFIEPVMQYVSEETRIPVIVDQARSGRLSLHLDSQDRDKLNELLRDSTKTNEQFNLLISAFCKSNPVIFKCFGGIEKHISLLLPDNILAQGGFIDLLNNTPYITDEDYSKSELIGWLYQFYISEKKDEVFAKKGKYDPDEIPAATQIFTPNWIVKYMVENTIGRIYLDNNPYADEIKASMKYLVEPSEPTPKDAILKLEDLAEYKMIDNACGSGHILIEGFKLFYRMYMYEGYSSRAAIENILQKNIIGLDLDTRAKQLATFALLMTAAQTDKSFLDCRVMPRVLDFPEPFSYPGGDMGDFFPHYYLGCSEKVKKESIVAFELLRDASSLGSIMKFEISAETRAAMEKSTAEWEKKEHLSPFIEAAIPSMKVILALTDKYTAAVMNPPYMSSAKFDNTLTAFIEKHFRDSKADLFSVFMTMGMNQLANGGKMGMINMQAWMFLTTFETFRQRIIESYQIDNILHLGPHTFDELSGEIVQNVAFVLSRANPTYFSTVFDLTKGNKCDEKESIFFSQKTLKRFNQLGLTELPGMPLTAYCLSESLAKKYTTDLVERFYDVKSGLSTGDNDEFIRNWTEVERKKMPTAYSANPSNRQSSKWIPYVKGGGTRKWYGIHDLVVNWYNEGQDIKKKGLGVFRNPSYYFKSGITWSGMSTKLVTYRYEPEGFIFDSNKGPMVFQRTKTFSIVPLLGFLNSKISNLLINIFNPSVSTQIGDVAKLLYLPELNNLPTEAIQCNIEISKQDWDAHETSWDFKVNELVRIYNRENSGDGLFVNANRLEDVVTLYKELWTSRFLQLHANEEELNRQFIEIYGLQNELTPDVPLNEITILQDGEISIESNKIVWHDDVLIKQLISYAIGCWFGRYRLDKEGLCIAHYPKDEEVCSYDYNGYSFEIDDDAIIPLMGKDNPFEDDNALQKVINFMKYVFGGDSFLTANMNFIEHCLGKSLEDYLVKDFWKDHKKMYQNRPIYWLFASKKGAFQVLTYMHRMNPYTVERIRTKYLLPYIEYLKGKIEVDEARGADLSTVERKNLQKMKTALEECNEYHDRLHEVAIKSIDFDLDDGVVVNYAKFGDVLAKIK